MKTTQKDGIVKASLKVEFYGTGEERKLMRQFAELFEKVLAQHFRLQMLECEDTQDGAVSTYELR